MGLIQDYKELRDFKKLIKSVNLDSARKFQIADLFNLDGESESKYVGTVYSAVDTWGLYFAKAKFRLYDETDKENVLEVNDHPMLQLFENPNPYQTWWELAYKMATHFAIFGNHYLYKIRNLKGEITAYQLLLPSLVKRKNYNNSSRLIDYYEYEIGEGKKLPVGDVIDLRYPSPDKQLEGFPIINSISDQVTVNALQMKYSKKALEKGGYLGLTFGTDKELSSQNFQQLLKRLEQRFGGSENAFKLALLDSGMKPIAPPYSPKDMQFGENRKSTKEDILEAFKVAKIHIGATDSANRANSDAAIYQFTSGVIDPILSYVDSVLTMHVKMDYGKQYRIEHDTLAPKDEAGLISFIESGLKNGWLTLNEARKLMDYDKMNYPLADVGCINVGGALIRIDTEEQIGAVPNNASQPVKMMEEVVKKDFEDLRWKQFDRRLTLAVRRFERSLGKYFDDQERRILEAVLNNYVVEQGFDLENENMLLHQLLEIDLWDIMKEGHKYGDSLYDSGTFHKSPLENDFKKIERNTFLINETTFDNIKKIDNESDLKKAYKEIQDSRKEMIAVTTACGAFNAGLLQAMKDAGIKNKMWLSMRDAKVREKVGGENHRLMDGVTVPIDEPFEVPSRSGKDLMMYPADPLGSPENIVNDRCTIIGR